MNIVDCKVYNASDLHSYGYTEDGTQFIGEVYFVEVENSRGDRWRHCVLYHGVRVEQGEYGPAYVDVRAEAVALCERLIVRIIVSGKIDLTQWDKAAPAYGSDAYIEYGQADQLAWEREEG